MDDPITLHYSRHGNNGTVTLTAKHGNETLAVEKLDVLRPDKREKFAASLTATRPGIDKAAVESELLRIAAELTASAAPASNGDAAKPDPLAATPPEVKAAALEMLRAPDLIRRVTDDIAALGVAGESKLAATVYLLGTSRLLDKPLAAIVIGPSSTGKSYVPGRVARLFPPECVLFAHTMTPQALVHLPQGALAHKFVVAGERARKQDDEAADATKSLREMLADGRLTKILPVKQSGEIVSVQIEQPGPIAFIESTTAQNIFEEDRNRCLLLNTDERPEQTRRILRMAARRKAVLGNGDATDGIIARHQAAQRLLQRCRVRIPFAERLAEHFPDHRADFRRGFVQLLSMIEAVTLLHQYQRVAEPADEQEIDATTEDYQISRHLLADPLRRSQTGGVSDAARRLYERMQGYLLGYDFTARDVANQEKEIGNVQTIRDYLSALAEYGYLEQTAEKRGNQPGRYKLAVHPPDDATAAGLPSVAVLFGDSAPHCRDKGQMAADTGFATREA